jgi:hypothetical protein
MSKHGIEPHIPILDREHQTIGHFTRADFILDAAANVFICPASKQHQDQKSEAPNWRRDMQGGSSDAVHDRTNCIKSR